MQDSRRLAYSDEWSQREATAERMVPVIGGLYRDRGVVLTLFGRSLVRTSPMEIIKAHRFSRRILQTELPVSLGAAMVDALAALDLPACKIDIGALAAAYQRGPAGTDVQTFVGATLRYLTEASGALPDAPRDIVLYGFGRVGRMLARILIERSGGGDRWRLRAVVVRTRNAGDLQKRASLLRRDSIHGPFNGTIQVDETAGGLVINGNLVHIIGADAPADIDYGQYGIDRAIVIDNSGVWRDRESLGQHLHSRGVDKVVLTAPGKGDIPNIIFGVNSGDIRPEERLISAASCTTNAIVPVLKAIDDRYHIEQAHVDTCHSYTNDQNLVDNYHSKSRRGRSAPLNMVITETGAADAVAKALPRLEGRITANAIRVPTPNVSLAILKLTLAEPCTAAEINEYLRTVSLDSPLRSQIDYTTSPEVVSSDFVGSPKTGIVDSLATICQGDQCVLYVWYDNEYGYACQVVRIVRRLADLELPTYPQ